jgi:N-acetyl-anhydromuramyl-L-alanine amidase AmpD
MMKPMKIVKPLLGTAEGEYKQILLCNTNRITKDFLKSIEVRKDGNYNKIPNYLIEKNGKVHHLTEDDATHHYLTGYHKDGERVIVICLENVGWLRRRHMDGRYVNWLGDIYNNKVYEKKWRGRLFWDSYTEKQIKKVIELTKNLCKKHKIPFEFMGHNVIVDGVENFNGVVCRSNYNEYWRDVNPSFNFELL